MSSRTTLGVGLEDLGEVLCQLVERGRPIERVPHERGELIQVECLRRSLGEHDRLALQHDRGHVGSLERRRRRHRYRPPTSRRRLGMLRSRCLFHAARRTARSRQPRPSTSIHSTRCVRRIARAPRRPAAPDLVQVEGQPGEVRESVSLPRRLQRGSRVPSGHKERANVLGSLARTAARRDRPTGHDAVRRSMGVVRVRRVMDGPG